MGFAVVWSSSQQKRTEHVGVVVTPHTCRVPSYPEGFLSSARSLYTKSWDVPLKQAKTAFFQIPTH